MKKKLFITLFTLASCFLIYFQGKSQSTIVTDDVSYTSPASGAVLDVNSSSKGLMIPRVTLVTLTNGTSPISSPATGLLVYHVSGNSIDPGFYYWSGTFWARVMIGGSSTNNTSFEVDGTLVLNGDATGWEDLRVPGLSAKTSGLQPPTLGPFGSSGNLIVNRFGGGSSINSVWFQVQMPHSWKEGSTIYPHIHWSPTTTNGGNVKWNIEYSWTNINSTFPTNSTDFVTQAASTTAWTHQMANFNSISGTGKTISSVLMIRLYRDPTDGDDTYGDDAAFIDFDVHYEINTIGSRSATAK